MVETFSYSVTGFYGVFIFIQSSITRTHICLLIREAINGLAFILRSAFFFYLCIFAGLVIEPRDLLMLRKHSTPSLSSSLPLFGLHLKSELISGDGLREGNKGGESNQSTFTLV